MPTSPQPALCAASDTQPMIAASWMMGAVASFTVMAIAARTVSIELDTFELLGWRSLFGCMILMLVITARRKWSTIDLHRPRLHLTRNLVHFTAQNLWFHAIFTIPLAQVFALEFTAPIWVLLISWLWLGERLTVPRAAAALLGFVGILLVAQPGSAPLSAGLIAAVLAAVGFAVTYILTRQLTQTATTLTILLWMTVSQTVFGLICAGLDGDIAWPTATAMPWVAVIGTTGLSAHFCIASALRVAPATVVMPFDFLRLPVIALVGMLLYNETVGFGVVAGAVLIIAGNYLNLRSEARKRRRG